MQITDEMADIAARILNKRLAEGNLYGVSREMLEAALALLPHPPEGGKMEAGKPVVYVSSQQLPHNPQHTYIACRLQPEGNFDTPLFASPTHEDTARGTGEPVAWRFKHPGDGSWSYCDERPVFQAGDQPSHIEPLYAYIKAVNADLLDALEELADYHSADLSSDFGNEAARMRKVLAVIAKAKAAQEDTARVADGIELAARFIEKRRDDYVQEHGFYDPTTGVTEFPGDGEEYVYELEEIIEGIRALSPSLSIETKEETK